MRTGYQHLTNPPDSSGTASVRHRRPRAGTRTRGAADALQTKIAIGVLNLDASNYQEQLQANIGELPDAAGCDAAFVALLSDDGVSLETVISESSGFAQCKAEVLSGEALESWPWLSERLGHLKVIEVADTLKGPRSSKIELERLADTAGAVVVGNTVDLTDMVTPGETTLIDFDIRRQDGSVYENTVAGSPFEWVSMQVFLYR